VNEIQALNNISPFLDTVKNLYNLKKTETYLHINNTSGWCVPLSISADLMLRTGLVSPVEFERELSNVLFEHTYFRTAEGREYQPTGENFFKQISIYDRTAVLWGVEKATYGDIIKDREIYCPNNSCRKEQKVTITLDELIQEDTYYLWDKKDDSDKIIPFFKYRKDFIVEDGDIEYVFRARIPSIYDNNEVMKRLDNKTISDRLRRNESHYTDIDRTILVTSGLGLKSKGNRFNPIFTENVDEIRISLDKYFPAHIIRDFLNSYDKDFKKYEPKYYSKRVCPFCGKKFKFHVDLEVELFFRITIERAKRDLSDITDSINYYSLDDEADDTSDSNDINSSNSEKVLTDSLFNDDELNETIEVESSETSLSEELADNSEQILEQEQQEQEIINIPKKNNKIKTKPVLVEDDTVENVVKL
jgi:hypothetical protein